MLKGMFINAKRNGYAPKQCGETLTIQGLIELLQEKISYYEYDPKTPIYLKNDNGYTYGSITESDFENPEEDEDD